MAEPTSSIRDRPGPVIAAVAGAVALGVAVAGTVYAVRLAEGLLPATPPLFVVADGLCAVVVAGTAWFVSTRGRKRVAAWIAGLAAALAGYVGAAAAAVALSPAGGPAASLAVALEKSWYVVALTVASLLVLVVIEELVGARRSLRAWRWLIGGLATITFVLALGVDPGAPYSDISAPLSGTILASDAGHVAFSIVNLAWILSTAVAPVLAWRYAASAPLREADHVRRRLTIVAIGAAAPLIALTTCLLLMAAANAGIVTMGVGAAVLSLVFVVPLVVLVAAVGAGVTVSAAATDVSVRLAIRWVLMGLWLLVGSQLVIIGASMIARGAGDSSLLVATAAAVIATVAFVAAYLPLSHRLLRFAGLDERAASTPPALLTDVLSPRERQVLERIARGHSNAAVAAELYVSERTVDTHVTAIFDKLRLDRSSDANRRVQAAAVWIRAEHAAGGSATGSGSEPR